MNQDTARRRKLLIISISILVFMVLSGLVLFLLFGNTSDKQRYSITIQNYDEKVKNVSKETREAIEGYLYLIVSMNTSSDLDGATITDARIREGSDSQSFGDTLGMYSGGFIVDIASIKQSYNAGYQDARGNLDFSGDPAIISCLDTKDLIYGSFDCKDFIGDSDKKSDAIIQYLPYKTLSYSISADARDEDNLIINAELLIPDSYLNGSTATRKAAVAAYKKEVTRWITSKGLDPLGYTIQYNYDDNGKLLK